MHPSCREPDPPWLPLKKAATFHPSRLLPPCEHIACRSLTDFLLVFGPVPRLLRQQILQLIQPYGVLLSDPRERIQVPLRCHHDPFVGSSFPFLHLSVCLSPLTFCLKLTHVIWGHGRT